MIEALKIFINDWMTVIKVNILFSRIAIFKLDEDIEKMHHSKLIDDFSESYDRIMKYLFVYNVGFIAFVVFVSIYAYLEKLHAI